MRIIFNHFLPKFVKSLFMVETTFPWPRKKRNLCIQWSTKGYVDPTMRLFSLRWATRLFKYKAMWTPLGVYFLQGGPQDHPNTDGCDPRRSSSFLEHWLLGSHPQVPQVPASGSWRPHLSHSWAPPHQPSSLPWSEHSALGPSSWAPSQGASPMQGPQWPSPTHHASRRPRSRVGEKPDLWGPALRHNATAHRSILKPDGQNCRPPPKGPNKR